MKRIYIITFLLIGCITLFNCKSDFLEIPPQSKLNTESFYNSVEHLKAGTAPLYCATWFSYNTRPAWLIGDIRAGDVLGRWNYPDYAVFTTSTLDENLLGAWSSFYTVINQSTVIMNNIKTYATGVTEAQKNEAYGECRFMRATAYFYLVRAWGEVPIIDDNSALLENYQVPKRPIGDIYKYIIRDLTFAVYNLPESNDAGRINKYSAEGMLAKVYLAYSGYGQSGSRDEALLDSAKLYAGDVYRNYPSPLLPEYENLFKYRYNNNQESLFSLQWVPLGSWGTQNATLSDYAFSTDVTGDVNCWSSAMASYDILKTYEKGDTIRRNATYFTRGSYYSYINISGGGYTYAGYNGGTADSCSSAHFKKYVPGGPNDDNDGYVDAMNSPLNTYMLRLADVYLVYAEASLGNKPSINSGEGFEALNKVRARAGMPGRTSITIDSIMYERRIELAFENQNWYDLVTWYYYMPAKILAMINGQHREANYEYAKDAEGNLSGIHITGEYGTPTNADDNDMYLPIPETEAIQNKLLSDDAVPYDFSNE
jgi:starch-binding outer membrane protein, SusD/RagB family